MNLPTPLLRFGLILGTTLLLSSCYYGHSTRNYNKRVVVSPTVHTPAAVAVRQAAAARYGIYGTRPVTGYGVAGTRSTFYYPSITAYRSNFINPYSGYRGYYGSPIAPSLYRGSFRSGFGTPSFYQSRGLSYGRGAYCW